MSQRQAQLLSYLEQRRIKIVQPYLNGLALDLICRRNGLMRAYGRGFGADLRRHPQIDLQITDPSCLPFADASFDTVSILAALNYIPQREATLAEVWRILKPSGQIIITMINRPAGYITHRFFTLDEDVQRGLAQGQLRGMTPQHVRELLLGANFKIVKEQAFQAKLNRLYVALKPYPPLTGQKPKLSVIVPVYNEQATLNELIERVCNAPIPTELDLEVIIADDGSKDSSPDIIADAVKKRPTIIKAHTSLINLGKGAAIRFGMEFASGDIILIQDADLELNPAEYPQLLAPILSGETGVVYGSRFKTKNRNIPLKTRLANRFLVWLTNRLYGSRLTDMATGYKVFRTDIVRSLTLKSSRFEFEPEVTAKLLKANYRIVEVPISYNPRTTDQGKTIGLWDGLEYIYTLFKNRIQR